MHQHSRHHLFAHALLLVLLALMMPSFAQAQTAACTNLVNGASQDITVGGACRKVTNNTGRTVCVPTGNATSWNSYITRTISGMTIASCGPLPSCTTQAITWGGGNCTANAGSTSSGNTRNLTDNTAPWAGTASALCTSGSWSVQAGETCNRTCAAQTVTWGGGNCTGLANGTTSGNTRNLTDNTATWIGRSSFVCDNGSWVLQAGSTCVSCPCQDSPTCEGFGQAPENGTCRAGALTGQQVSGCNWQSCTVCASNMGDSCTFIWSRNQPGICDNNPTSCNQQTPGWGIVSCVNVGPMCNNWTCFHNFGTINCDGECCDATRGCGSPTLSPNC